VRKWHNRSPEHRRSTKATAEEEEEKQEEEEEEGEIEHAKQWIECLERLGKRLWLVVASLSHPCCILVASLLRHGVACCITPRVLHLSSFYIIEEASSMIQLAAGRCI
jgi:beta-phosphoglucomutase-like phosphatase (HAD superfamily)